MKKIFFGKKIFLMWWIFLNKLFKLFKFCLKNFLHITTVLYFVLFFNQFLNYYIYEMFINMHITYFFIFLIILFVITVYAYLFWKNLYYIFLHILIYATTAIFLYYSFGYIYTKTLMHCQNNKIYFLFLDII